MHGRAGRAGAAGGSPRGIGAWLLVLALSVAAALPARASHGVLVAAPIEYVKRLVEAGQPPVFVDLRPADEFRRGRLPGARSLPLRELPERYPEISPLTRVVLYCSCSFQELEVAFRLLESRGYANVSVMLEGFAEWASRGYPVER